MKIDMSAIGVTARLKLTSQLRRLCLSLAQGRTLVQAADLLAKDASMQKDQPRTDANK